MIPPHLATTPTIPYTNVFFIFTHTSLLARTLTLTTTHTHLCNPSPFTIDATLAITLSTTVTFTRDFSSSHSLSPHPYLQHAYKTPLSTTYLIHTEYLDLHHATDCTSHTTPHPRPLTVSSIPAFAFLSNNDLMPKTYS